MQPYVPTTRGLGASEASGASLQRGDGDDAPLDKRPSDPVTFLAPSHRKTRALVPISCFGFSPGRGVTCFPFLFGRSEPPAACPPLPYNLDAATP